MDPRSQVPAEVATALETPPGAVKLGLGSFSPASNGQIPDVGDTTIRKPTAGKIRISQEAIDARLRRVFTPNIKGSVLPLSNNGRAKKRMPERVWSNSSKAVVSIRTGFDQMLVFLKA